VKTAADAGLRWLGESDPAQNLPQGLDEAVFEKLRANCPDALSLQIAADAAAGRTFRSGVLCRNDAPIEARVSLERVFGFSVRAGFIPSELEDQPIHDAISAHAPACIPMRRVRAALPGYSTQDLARQVFDGIYQGWILTRIEPVEFDVEPPDFPKLNGFRLECARRGLPLVDIWHRPCSFPVRHYEVLAKMDGTRDLAGLAAFSRQHCPELAFEPWLRHLAGRGIFA